MSKARDLADLGNAYSDGALSNRNMIINGAMQVAQRGTSVAGLSGANSYKTVDRYTTYISSLGTWTQSQDTDAPSGFGHSLKMLCTTADASPASTNRMLIQTKIEGQDVQSLGFGDTSNTYTVSFYVKSNVTGTYILEQYGDTASDTGNNISTAYTVDTADTWERKTITLNVDSGAMTADNTSGLVLSFWLGTGSNYSSGTLNTSWSVPSAGDRAVGQVNIASDINNYWQITGVQLEVGDTATPFEHRSYGDELAKCKRYYERYDDTGTGLALCAGMWYDTTTFYGPLLFEVEKRTNPTFSYNTSGSYEAYRAGTNSLTSTVSVSRTTVHGTRINLSGLSGSGTAGQGSWIEIDGNGYLVFDAEL
jgi:hypothetical protein